MRGVILVLLAGTAEAALVGRLGERPLSVGPTTLAVQARTAMEGIGGLLPEDGRMSAGIAARAAEAIRSGATGLDPEALLVHVTILEALGGDGGAARRLTEALRESEAEGNPAAGAANKVFRRWLGSLAVLTGHQGPFRQAAAALRSGDAGDGRVRFDGARSGAPGGAEAVDPGPGGSPRKGPRLSGRRRR